MGSISGGVIVKYGRRPIIIIFLCVAIVGTIMSLFLNYPLMCAGRFVNGFASGVLLSANPKLLGETLPMSQIGERWFGTSPNYMITAGIMINMLLGLGYGK